MAGLTITMLLAAAAVLMFGRRPDRQIRRRGRGPNGPSPGKARKRRDRTDADAPALLVRELAGLLAAGRPAYRIWADAATLYAAGAPRNAPAHPFAAVLQAAAASAALGLSPVPVLAAAGRAGDGAPDPLLRELWAGLAVCVRVSERSGAPLSRVLTRYAGQLDAARDAASDRESALAGPRATMRLLTWLPGGGIILGYLLGGNPLQILTATPLGWSAAAAGGGFWLAGRVWSGRLVRDAAKPAEDVPG